MFHKVILDETRESASNVRFFACLKLVADETIPAAMYLHENWLRIDYVQSAGEDPYNISPWFRAILEKHDLVPDMQKNMSDPKLVCLPKEAWEKRPTGETIPALVPTREMIASHSAIVHKATLADQGLNPTTAILALASVGLDIMLPNVTFSHFADEEIAELKERYSSERFEYLNAVSLMAEEAYDRLKSGSYSDLLRWADAQITFKVVPKAIQIQESVAKAGSKTLRRAGYSFWKDGTPAIGAAYLSGGFAPAAVATADQAIRTLVATIAGERERRLLPEVAYAMKLKQSLEH